MKRTFAYILFSLLYIPLAWGSDVTDSLALKMANVYYKSIQDYSTCSNPENQASNRKAECISPLGKAKMWLVPVEDGWILLSGDMRATPILAHIQSTQKPIYDSLPTAVKELFNTFEDYIYYISEHDRNSQIDERWMSVISGNNASTPNDRELITEVEPLLDVHWNQAYGGSCSLNKTYNKFCPAVNNSNICNKAYAGCVAVAIAQILWYWKWPYAAHVPTTVGGNTSTLKFYDWDKMPTHINNDTDMEMVDMVAGLLRDCGYKLNMDYGPNGSSANDSKALTLFRDWGYNNDIRLRLKSSTPGWTNLLRTNIDNGIPIYYTGWSNFIGIGGNGHTFVVDGYRTGMNPTYHINWGWGGSYNGWYNIDEAFINDTIHYEHWQAAIFDLRPSPICKNTISDINITFSSNFCMAIGGELTLSNLEFENVEQGKIYSSTQIKLTSGVRISNCSNIQIAIKPIPCQSTPNLSESKLSIKAAMNKKCSNTQTIDIIPNPVHDAFYVFHPKQLKHISIYTLSGQCVLQTTQTQVNISHLPTGIYIVHAYTHDGERLTDKFIKQ